MKIQPQKNANLPKYAAAIAACMSAGLLGGIAASGVPAVAEMEEVMNDETMEMTELAGTGPSVMETTMLAGTSPIAYGTEVVTTPSTTPVRLEGVPPIVTTPENETTELRMEGTSPAVTTAFKPIETEPLLPEGTYPAPTTLAPATTTTELRLEGTFPAITTPKPETTTELRLEGTSPAVTTPAPETAPLVTPGIAPAPQYEVTDAVKLQKHLLGKAPADAKMRAQMDLDGDGVLDTYDLGLLKRELLKEHGHQS